MAKFEITYEQTEAFHYLALEVKGAYSQIPGQSPPNKLGGLFREEQE